MQPKSEKIYKNIWSSFIVSLQTKILSQRREKSVDTGLEQTRERWLTLTKVPSLISPKEPPTENWVNAWVNIWFTLHSCDPHASPDLSSSVNFLLLISWRSPNDCLIVIPICSPRQCSLLSDPLCDSLSVIQTLISLGNLKDWWWFKRKSPQYPAKMLLGSPGGNLSLTWDCVAYLHFPCYNTCCYFDLYP